MRFIKNQLWLGRIVLIIGVAAIAIPIATRVSPSAIAVVAKHSKESKASVSEGVARHQDDDYYERRREYWDKRVERRLDREDLDEQTADDKDADAKGTKAGKDKKDSKEAADDDDEDVDDADREIERRREYWRKRVDKEW